MSVLTDVRLKRETRRHIRCRKAMRHRSYVNLLCSSPRAIRGSRIDLPGGRILVGGTLNVSFLCLCFSFLCRHRLVIRLVGRSGGKDIFYLGSFAFVGCYWVIFGHLIRCACSQRCFALGGTEKKNRRSCWLCGLGDSWSAFFSLRRLYGGRAKCSAWAWHGKSMGRGCGGTVFGISWRFGTSLYNTCTSISY